MHVVSDVYYLCSFDSLAAVLLFMNSRYLALSQWQIASQCLWRHSLFVFQLRPHCLDVGSPHTIYKRANEILTSIAQLNLCLPAFEEISTRLHTAIKLRVLHTGLVGRLSSGKYFAFHAAAAGLSDRDGKDTLYVVSVLHLGLGNTLVRPGRCIYGHQNMHRKTQYGCCCGCCCFFKFLMGWIWLILGDLA